MKALLKINDKEIEVEVSEETIEQLTKKKSPFDLYGHGGDFYYIDVTGKLNLVYDNGAGVYERMNKVGNYCTDRNLIQQQAYRETLNRLLWRWQYENDEPVDWSKSNKKWSILYDHERKDFCSLHINLFKESVTYFSTNEKAEQAIKEVVKPFMAEHPDFVW